MRFMDIRVVFMGSPDFALPTLKALDENFSVVGVVTQPDRPAGRGQKLQSPDVKVLAQFLDLPIIQPATLKDPDALSQIEAWEPDVIVVDAFGQILRENVLNLPPHGCVNVHASLLPRWRGAAPVQAAVLYDEVTGVTIMKMDKGLDTGPILSQSAIQIPQEITAGELFNMLAAMGADLLIETLPDYVLGCIQPQPQDEEQATYAPRLNKMDGELDFSLSASFLSRKVRAFNPWPGAYTNVEGTALKIFRTHTQEGINIIPGRRYVIEDKPALGTSQGYLVLDEVQLAGRGRLSGTDFLRGAKNWSDEKEQSG